MAEDELKATENPEGDAFDFGKKKKKKKNKDLDLAESEISAEVGVPEVAKSLEGLKVADGEPKEAEAEETLDFTQLKKKDKKDKKGVSFAPDGTLEFQNEADAARATQNINESDQSRSWQDSERDYTYEELIERVFNIMKEKNPDMVTGEKKKFTMKPPQVARVGTKKTSFANFADICKLLRRQERHLLNFLLAELGTSGSLDSNTSLTIKGRFSQKQIENVLRRYIREYVTCHTCRSPETQMSKEERIFFLQCSTCGSKCAVASIRSGFQAQVGKRAAQRAKAT